MRTHEIHNSFPLIQKLFYRILKFTKKYIEKEFQIIPELKEKTNSKGLNSIGSK